MTAGIRALLAVGVAVAMVALTGAAATLRSEPSIAAAASTTPVLGQSETLTLASGAVSVRTRGSRSFTPLSGSISVPDQSEVDATHGRVRIEVAAATPGQTSTAVAYRGRFVLHQESAAPGETHLILSQPLSGCSAAHRAQASAYLASSKGRHGKKLANSGLPIKAGTGEPKAAM